FSAARGVYNTLSRYRVKYFLLFSVRILRRILLTRRRVCRCSVSVVAHYRELFRPDKRKFKIIFQPRIFYSLCLFQRRFVG
ncbi:hypothetical protein D6X60_15915, partial [Escherichia albertii]|nr:hypothetical protein [Escherichia albertii]EEW7341955.1 hypothetical protein [Escherichia albertii]